MCIRDRHELGVENVFRETYLSALALTQSLLAATHQSVELAEQTILQFRQYDETVLKAEQQAESGSESLYAQHHSSMAELSYLFEQDQHRKNVINPIQKQQNVNGTGIDTITDDLS